MLVAITKLRSRIEQLPFAGRFLKGAAWSTGGAILSSAIALAITIVLARVLGKETYGQFVLVQSTLSMVGVFAGFGIGAAAGRHVAEFRSRDTVRLSRILALTERALLAFGFVVSITLLLGSRELAAKILNSPHLAMPLAIAAFSVLFSALDGYQKCVLIGLEAMRAFAIGTVASAVLGAPITLIAAKLYGLNGAAGGFLLTSILQASISRWQMTQQLDYFLISRDGLGCASEWRVIRDFALPALLTGVLIIPAHWVCQTMLANTENGYSELALLGVAMQWFNVIMFLPSVAGRVILPILTDHLASKKHGDAKSLLLLAVIANVLITMPVAILAALLNNYILQLYGPEFQNGSTSLTIAVFSAILFAAQAPVGNMVVAASRMWLGTIMYFGWAAIYISLAYLMLAYGAVGVVSAMAVAYLFHSIWMFTFAIRQLNPAQ